MNNLDRIEKLRELEEEKMNIEKKLNNVNEKMNTLKGECSHVGVLLNFTTFQCVICKQNIADDEFPKLKEQGLIIYANDYLSEVKDSQERLDLIQTMYLGLCRQNDDKTDAEIVKIFNQMIQEIANIKRNNNDSNPKALKRTN